MKKITLAILTIAAASSAWAQSAPDAYSLVPNQLRGTARFMSMGGAFTSLGSDLSVLTQNPAGMGLYRSSEIGATLDIDLQRFTASTSAQQNVTKQTKAYCNNFGYVGAVRLGGGMEFFQWGVTYNRINSFDRTFSGYNYPTETSLTNYIASYTNGVSSADLNFGDNYNPYYNSDADRRSILAYTSFLINNVGNNDKQYKGLYQQGTVGDAEYTVRERGYTDEYNIDFAGNVGDMVYWGVGVGIYDMSYQRSVRYSESMANADISTETSNFTGDAGFDLYNYKSISASGANLKLGLIVRPTGFLRIGAAIHTPTWLACTTVGDGKTSFSLLNPNAPESTDNPFKGGEESEMINYNWRTNTPWRFMLGASYTLGSLGVISADYERVQYPDQTVSYQAWDGWQNYYVADDNVNADIKKYYLGTNIFRVGAEVRVTPQFYLRAGFNSQSSSSTLDAQTGRVQVYTAGTDPSFDLNKQITTISCGLGYRYKHWYIDAAYAHSRHESQFHAYTDFDGFRAPSAGITATYNSIVLSTGFRF